MASSTVPLHFICHFCFGEYFDRASIISHFSQCHNKTSMKKSEETIRLPRLNKIDQDILHMLKLHPSNSTSIAHKPQDKPNLYLQIPLSLGYMTSSKQSSFDDSSSSLTNGIQSEQDIPYIHFNSKSSSSYHIYKYSRREQKNFYASVKRARLKKQYSIIKKSHPHSLIFKQKTFRINLPTQITSRQRLNTNSNNSYPLIFDPNFHSLVQISTNNRFHAYFPNIKIYFHLLHSIASQEFQIIVNSNDNQHHVSYTAFSFVNILRQTMTDYSMNLQKSLKRNYFQTFQQHDPQVQTPVKIRRTDQSTASHVQIEENNTSQQRFETQTNHILPATTTTAITIENETSNSIIHAIQSDLTIIDHQQSTDRTNTEPIVDSFIPIVQTQKSHRSASPIFRKEQKIEPAQNEQPVYTLTNARIRIINGSNETKKQTVPRQKQLATSSSKSDENSLVRSTRMNTRKSSIKTEVVPDICPRFQSVPVILSSSEISKQWLTHQVFYRCHACSHEEFFVVLSRECMNLHISSKHGNMEENFKQRLSDFLNKKGRSLKIFQHFLKWQQPWSDKEIEQIFQLSNK